MNLHILSFIIYKNVIKNICVKTYTYLKFHSNDHDHTQLRLICVFNMAKQTTKEILKNVQTIKHSHFFIERSKKKLAARLCCCPKGTDFQIQQQSC